MFKMCLFVRCFRRFAPPFPPPPSAAGYVGPADGTGAHPRAGAPTLNPQPRRRAAANNVSVQVRAQHKGRTRTPSERQVPQWQALLLAVRPKHALYRARRWRGTSPPLPVSCMVTAGDRRVVNRQGRSKLHLNLPRRADLQLG